MKKNYIETLDEFIIDNYSDLFEDIKKPVLGKDFSKMIQQSKNIRQGAETLIKPKQ